ncbi:MAG: hypothetical protein L0Y57_03660 [Beijerinckiaceae bacterium]|nr:hypothetical protein [Beijerinckiaceae bacterium]
MGRILLMKNHTLRLLSSATIVGASVLAAAPSQAATEIWDPTLSSCTGLNCSSVQIAGIVPNYDGYITQRWQIGVYASGGECLRVDETQMFANPPGPLPDDEMVVVAPNGDVYRNDNFSSLRPRVAFIAPVTGFYYVSIAQVSGRAAPEHDIFVAYGRYPSGNPNCANPTSVNAAFERLSKPAQAEPVELPPPNSPTAR